MVDDSDEESARTRDHRQAVSDHWQAVSDHDKAATRERNAGDDEAAEEARKAEDRKKADDENKKEDQKEQDDKKKQADGKGVRAKPLWPWVVGGVIVLGFILIVLYLVLAPQPRQKTDDAYVTAHYSAVAPRVGGQIVQVAVDDNQPVRTGQLLVLLDDRDLRTSLDEAQAALAGDQARVAQTASQVRRQPDLILQAQAQVASSQARLELSASNARRYGNLAATGAGTVQQRQQSDVALREDQAGLANALAQRNAARHQLNGLRADLKAAGARVLADGAQVTQAQLNLSYTRITAAIDGVVDQRSIQVGNYVTPGTPILTIVPLQGVYVIANYRESALHHMRPGQQVLIHVDAYDIHLNGVVESLPPSSGAAYSPIAANNATGNFTKIVQRFPVKITFLPNQALLRLIRVGMSVETVVSTHLDDVVGATRHDAMHVAGTP